MSLVVIALFFTVSFVVTTSFVVTYWYLRQRFSPDMPLSRVRLEPGEDDEAIEAASAGIFKRDELSSISVWHHLLTKFHFIAILRRNLEQAGTTWTVGRMTLAMMFSAMLVFSLTWETPLVPTWLVVLLVPAASMVPYAWILRMRDARFRKFREVFPDALDTMSRALRAGSPVAGSLQSVAEETAEPVASELRRVMAEQTLGMSLDRALDNLATRMPTTEVSLFVTALQIHSRTGGRLGDVMSRLSESIRESVALEGEIRAVAAHGKLTGAILTVLPIVIVAMMTFVSPGYIRSLLDHPIGKDLIAAAVACLVLAHFVIRKLVQIEL